MATKLITNSQYFFLKWLLKSNRLQNVYYVKDYYTFLATPEIVGYFQKSFDNIMYDRHEDSNGEMYIKIKIVDFVNFISQHQEYPANSMISHRLNTIKKDFEKDYLNENNSDTKE